MTKGFAILCMIVLHLFCRIGDDVLGTPLLYINRSTPFVYLFGFFSEICVPLYSICAGYGIYLSFQKSNYSFKCRFQRIFKLIKNYWVILFLFCLIGLFINSKTIPGNTFDFIKSIFLLHSYNGAWWYLNTYIILMLLPTALILFPIKKINHPFLAFGICFAFILIWYLLFRFDILNSFDKSNSIFHFLGQELYNLLGILPDVWIGCFICKFKIFEKLNAKINKHLPKHKNLILILLWLLLFIFSVVIHKSVLMSGVAILVFLIFNLIKKPIAIEKFFLFLGKHSTNIWLTHMFFYLILFKDFVLAAKYPLLILVLLLLLCIITSYIIFGIQHLIHFFYSEIKKLFKKAV